MAFTYTTASGSVLIIPQSSINVNVISNPSGNATAGVLALVGEAEEGPSWDQDAALGNKLSSNAFGPNDIGSVVQKYGSGNLVDAFRGAITPSASTRIQGAPNSIILVKTNQSAKASYNTLDGHGEFEALLGGSEGNNIQETVMTIVQEVAASTSKFSYVPSASSSALALRVNGGAQQTLAISANETPAALAAALTGLANVNAVGGVDISILGGLSGINISLTVISGQSVSIALATPNVFSGAPAVGDTIRIPTGSVIAGGGNANVGWYVVTGVSNVSANAAITALKITAGAPANVAATPISGTPANDMLEYNAISINNMSGTNRNILTGLVGQNITSAAVGSSLTLTLAASQVFASSPRAGDIVYIPAGSAFEGAGNANVGWYQIVASSNTSFSAFIQMSRLSNGSPVSVGATAVVAVSDVQDYDVQIKGIGKAMEIYDNNGSVNINTVFYNLGTNVAASWLSQLLVSSAELEKTIMNVRNSTNSFETFNVGGDVALQMGYNGTSASCTISVVGGVLTLTTSVSGGSGGNLNLNLSNIATISDLVSKINANTGYLAAVGSAADGQKNPSILDEETFTIASSIGHMPGRVKHDLWDITGSPTGVNSGSSLIEYIPIATAGLPQDNAAAFLSGGLKGGTSGLQFSNAIDALQGVRCNFVVPLVSQDASADIPIGATDPSSTYTVDAVNAAVKSHCLAMSTEKVKRHRVGIVSKKNTFASVQAAAQNLASFRIAMLFQDVLDLNSQGAIEQFQPWYGSCKAAGMQAAGSYKAIFNKNVNISGIKNPSGFDDENTSNVETAIEAGLIPIQTQDTGGFNFVTDQMTYSLDNNFVYNSLQAVYVADQMALSLAAALQTAFVGESVADVTTGAVISFIEGQMAEFLALKFTASSPQQGAPNGWVSISVNIIPGVLIVNVVAVEATAIKFIPINLNIEGIQSSATASGV